jgi:hypothetical protein
LLSTGQRQSDIEERNDVIETHEHKGDLKE